MASAAPSANPSTLGTVRFDSQSATLSEGAKAELSRVAQSLRGVAEVELRGYAQGSDPANDRKVALARALAVRGYLIDLGVTSKVEIASSSGSDGGSGRVDILGAPRTIATSPPNLGPPSTGTPAAMAAIATQPIPQPAVSTTPALTTLFFAPRSAEITEAGKADLARLAKSLKDARAITLRSNAGGTDADDGRKIALARALAVRAYLVDIGVKSSKVDFGTFSYTPSAGGTPTEYVDIVAP